MVLVRPTIFEVGCPGQPAADVYMISAEGSNGTNITNNSASDLLPDWQPT